MKDTFSIPINTHYICASRKNYYFSYPKYIAMNDKTNLNFKPPAFDVKDYSDRFYCADYQVSGKNVSNCGFPYNPVKL